MRWDPFSSRRQFWQMILGFFQPFSRVESHFSGLSSRTAYKRRKDEELSLWRESKYQALKSNVSIWPQIMTSTVQRMCTLNSWFYVIFSRLDSIDSASLPRNCQRLTMIWFLRDEDKDWSWRLQMWSWTPASRTPFPSLTTFVGTHVGDERYVARYNASHSVLAYSWWV